MLEQALTLLLNQFRKNTTYWTDLSVVAMALNVPVGTVPSPELLHRIAQISLNSLPMKFLSISSDLGVGWKNLQWFGNFFVQETNWFFHEVLGPMYVATISDNNSTWFYVDQVDPNLSGWI